MPGSVTNAWKFALGSDDGSTLCIDGLVVVANPGALAGPEQRGSQVMYSAGQRPHLERFVCADVAFIRKDFELSQG